MNVFFTDEDRTFYVRSLQRQARKHGLEILSWCLMTNHIHLVAVPETVDSLARAVGETHRLYTLHINRREGVKGHLFQERFFSCAMDEAHFIAAVRYVERNPVRAGIVAEAVEYPWSSAGFRVGDQQVDPLVLTRSPFGLSLDWEWLLSSEPTERERIRRRTRTGRPVGSDAFLARAEEISGRKLSKQRKDP
jgi:putative transposase